MLDHSQLCRAAFALHIVDERGDRDELRYRIREATSHLPAGDRESLTCNQRIFVDEHSKELARLLGVPQNRAEEAVLAAFGYSTRQITFDTLIAYAIELHGPCVELTGQPQHADAAKLNFSAAMEADATEGGADA